MAWRNSKGELIRNEKATEILFGGKVDQEE